MAEEMNPSIEGIEIPVDAHGALILPETVAVDQRVVKRQSWGLRPFDAERRYAPMNLGSRTVAEMIGEHYLGHKPHLDSHSSRIIDEIDGGNAQKYGSYAVYVDTKGFQEKDKELGRSHGQPLARVYKATDADVTAGEISATTELGMQV